MSVPVAGQQSLSPARETLLLGHGELLFNVPESILQTNSVGIFFPPATFSQYLQTSFEGLSASWQNTLPRGWTLLFSLGNKSFLP